MSTDRVQPAKEPQPATTRAGNETATVEQAGVEAARALVGFDARLFAPRSTTQPAPTPRQVFALQRLAGNSAVAMLLGRPSPRVVSRQLRAGGRQPRGASRTARLPERQHADLQRQSPTEAAAAELTPEERIDEATFDGFNAWAEAAIADADETCEDAQLTANRLSSPYQHRLNMLIQDVVDVRNRIDNGKFALGQGRAAPGLTNAPEAWLNELEDSIADLREVTDAWDAVMASGLLQLLALVAEAQVALARRLKSELEGLLAEMRELQRIASGAELRQAFAQTGLNVVISGTILVLTALVPPAGVALAVGSAVVQLSLDHCLGSPPGALSYGAAGSSISGARLSLPRYTPRLQTFGRRLGAVGMAAGTVSDILETREAIQNYEAAAARLRVVGARIDRIVPQLSRLMPLLEHPDMVERMIEGMRSHAETLRENGQVTLATAGQL